MATFNSTKIKGGTKSAVAHVAIAEGLHEDVLKHYMPSMKDINKKKGKFSAVSTFSGCGGASVGMKMSGFNVLWSNEFIPSAQDTYRANHPNTILDCNDIRDITAKQILKTLGLKKGELDLFEGSPPCKGYSTAGTKEEGWGKEVEYSDGVYQRVDDLFDNYTRLLKGLKPKVFIAENVAGILQGSAKGEFYNIMKDFKACGYKVKASLIKPQFLGLPQTRARVIFIGVRNDLPFEPVFPPLNDVRRTVRGVLPNILRIKTKVRDTIQYVDSNVPSPTITAGDFDSGENARFSCGGWIEDSLGRTRKYNLNELRRLMSFPDDFKLSGEPRQQWERLGRSHAPLQVFYLCKEIRDRILIPYYDSKGADYTDNIK